MPEQNQYKIKQSHILNLIHAVQVFLNRVFIFLSLKKTKHFWGIIYDSMTKQPLDPVIVNLLYVDGREVETVVTNLQGRYGFLARPGTFKIFPSKSNYAFPSRIVTGASDGLYKNIYHGEFFRLNEDSEVVAPNIPMDPVNTDWNQQAKEKIINIHPYTKFLVKQLVALIFWLGFLWALVGTYQDLPNFEMPFRIVVVYLGLIFLSRIIQEARLWGKVSLAQGVQPQGSFLLIELFNPKFPSVNFGRAKVREDGKFLLRVGRGRYLLSINAVDKFGSKTFLGNAEVKVGSLGVYNGNLTISN